MRFTTLTGLVLAFALAGQSAWAAPHACEGSSNDVGKKGDWRRGRGGVLVPGKAPPTIKEQIGSIREDARRKQLILPKSQRKHLYVPTQGEKKPLTVIRGGDSKTQVAEALEGEGLFEEAVKYNGHPTSSGIVQTPAEKLRRGAASLNRPGLQREVFKYEPPAAPGNDVKERVSRVLGKFFLTGNTPGEIVPVRMEGQAPVGSVSANEAYDNAGHTFNFFKSVMGRFSIDDKGMPIRAVTHQGDLTEDGDVRQMANAYYRNSDKHIRFGKSGSMRFTSTTITGHELAHGVTAHTAGLVYSGQSGALNEHFSDVFGVAIAHWKDGATVDHASWDIGGDGFELTSSRRSPIRSMANPAAQGQPGHMNDYVHTESDHGGVHSNSGIPNRAFYVAAKAMGGNVWERAAKVWYVALRDYLDEDADFAKCARATVHVAKQIYGDGSREHLAVKTGWKAVGIEVNDDDPAPLHRSQRPMSGFEKKTVTGS